MKGNLQTPWVLENGKAKHLLYVALSFPSERKGVVEEEGYPQGHFQVDAILTWTTRQFSCPMQAGKGVGLFRGGGFCGVKIGLNITRIHSSNRSSPPNFCTPSLKKQKMSISAWGGQTGGEGLD